MHWHCDSLCYVESCQRQAAHDVAAAYLQRCIGAEGNFQ